MYYIGIDLGKKHDPTAIALVERPEPHPSFRTPGAGRFEVIGLERVPLGTPYMDVVERVAALTMRPALVGRCVVVVDATGVGAPVVEALRRRLTCEVTAVTI
ncbi:MAG TPA: hypothetical protein VNH18_35690, partial [Bryobacteraceae bacterium]|nr:hypothetical protein [Bryobacteraceae bacterium]